MLTELLLTILGIAFAIGFIILAARLIQKWFERRLFASSSTAHQWGDGPDVSPTLTSKIRSQAGIDHPELKIITRLAIPFSRDSIVLLNRKIEPYSNLLRCHPDGTYTWIANFFPHSYVHVDDLYTYVAWNQGMLVANIWSGYRVILDVRSGKIIKSEFTK